MSDKLFSPQQSRTAASEPAFQLQGTGEAKAPFNILKIYVNVNMKAKIEQLSSKHVFDITVYCGKL